MRRLHILAKPHTPTAEDPREWLIYGGDDGMAQIASFARALADETGVDIVFFEVMWPWAVDAGNVWDALEADVTKIGAADETNRWATTLPPYAELTGAQRQQLGLPDA